MEKILTKEVITTICIILFAVLFYMAIKQLISRVFLKKARHHSNKKALTLLTILTNVVKYIILVIALLMILATWGVDTKALVASLGVAGAVAGLAMQDLIKDFNGGADILTEDQFKVGDNIQIGNFRGNVIYLGMKITKIRAYTGEVKIIANRNISEVINYSIMSAICVVDIGLSYDNKVDQAEKVLQTAIENASKKVNYLKKPVTILGIEELNNDSVVYRHWLPDTYPPIIDTFLFGYSSKMGIWPPTSYTPFPNSTYHQIDYVMQFLQVVYYVSLNPNVLLNNFGNKPLYSALHNDKTLGEHTPLSQQQQTTASLSYLLPSHILPEKKSDVLCTVDDAPTYSRH